MCARRAHFVQRFVHDTVGLRARANVRFGWLHTVNHKSNESGRRLRQALFSFGTFVTFATFVTFVSFVLFVLFVVSNQRSRVSDSYDAHDARIVYSGLFPTLLGCGSCPALRWLR